MKQPSATKSKVEGSLARLAYLPQVFALIWRAAARWTIAWSILLVLQGILPAVSLYLTRAVVDSLVLALNANGDWRLIQWTLWLIALTILVMLAGVALRSGASWLDTGLSELVQDHVSRLIHQQASTVDLGFYETATYYDRLERAHKDAAQQPVALLKNIGNVVRYGITLLAMAGVLLSYGVWIPLLLLGSTLPAFGVILKYTRQHNAWRVRTTYERRRAHYYEYLLTDYWPAAEMRLYDLSEHFQAAYQAVRQRLRSEQVRLMRNRALAELAAGFWALLGTGTAMGWMLRQAFLGNATLGDLALFYQAFGQGQTLARTLLDSIGDIYRNTLFLENLFEFLQIKSQLPEPSQPQAMPALLRQGISFHQVTFRYPESGAVAVEGMNLHFPAGRMSAIVGANGAGKSTLVKLLARFYDPTSGQITVDGIDLRDFALHDLRRQISIMFQLPMHYATTAEENIALGDLSSQPTRKEIEAAARAAGATQAIDQLPDGYDAMLGKWFGGTELSIGEWQRIALARAFLRQAGIIILDEPTSAMDSWAEAEWLARFRQMVAGRTTIIITHRFTTAMQADIIHVMDQGQVIESGTHEALCAMGGRYAESWYKQTQTARTTNYGVTNGYPMAA